MSNFININNIFKSVYGDIKKEMITNSKYLFMKHKIFKSYNKIFKIWYQNIWIFDLEDVFHSFKCSNLTNFQEKPQTNGFFNKLMDSLTN